jgi:hypothetical protein
MPITAVLTAVLKEQKQEIKIQDENLTNLENEVQNLKAELLQH